MMTYQFRKSVFVICMQLMRVLAKLNEMPRMVCRNLRVGNGTAQEDGAKAVLGPGTGLGVSGLVLSPSPSG